MRGAVRWTCRTKSDSDGCWHPPDPSAAPWAYHLLAASLLGLRQQTLQGTKNTFYIPQIFMHISQYTFYYHFNKYKTTLWFFLKRKQWVLKRHENALDIRNINLNFGMFFYWHLVLRWMNQHIFFLFFFTQNQKSPQQKKKKRGRQNRTWEGYFCQWKWNGIIKWRCVWIYTHIYTYINTTRM